MIYKNVKLSEIFTIKKTTGINTNKLSKTESRKIAYVTRTSLNNGIHSYTNKIEGIEPNPKKTISIGLLDMTAFYQKTEWYSGQFVRLIEPKFEINEKIAMFFLAYFKKLRPIWKSVLVRDFDETFNATTISLPFNVKNEIDFKYIEQYIREVEEQYIREVDDYLKAIGYSSIIDCQLSDQDKNIIKEEVKLKSFKLCDIFEKVDTEKINYTVKTVPRIKSEINSIPVTCSSSMNNSIAGYVPKEGITVLKNMISVCSNGSCKAFYQKNEFSILQDSYALKYKGENQSENVYLFLLSSLSLLLRKYNWSNKPGWNKIKDEIVCIPYNYKDDEIDSSYMEKYIEVIKKIKVLRLKEKIDDELELLKSIK